MLEQIKQILAQMAALGADLSSAMRGQESRMFFQIKGKLVKFELAARDAHRELKTGF